MANAARQTKPRSLSELVQTEAESLFTTLPPALAAKCREEFRRGAMEVHNRRAGVRALSSDPESAATESTLKPVDTPPQRSALSKREVLSTMEPLVAPIQGGETLKLLTDLSYVFGHEVNKARLKAVAMALHAAGWTRAELEYAVALIPTDAALCKTISFERTIAPGVFAEAKTRPEVMRGRLHDHATAVAYSQERGRTLSECAEVVYVEGDDTPRWRLK